MLKIEEYKRAKFANVEALESEKKASHPSPEENPELLHHPGNANEKISNPVPNDNEKEPSENYDHLVSSDDEEMIVDDNERMPTFQDLQAKENPNPVERALLSRPNDAKLIFANYPKLKQRGKRIGKNYVGFNSVHRKLLCEVIIKEELKTVTQQISSDRFKLFANAIEQLFPKEKASVYYSPHLTIRKNNKVFKKRAARGKLYHKYTNLRKKLKDGGLIENDVCNISNVDTLDVNQTVSEALIWLEKRVEICSRVSDEWKLTRDARISELRSTTDANKNYLHEYFNQKYPFLKQPQGYSLIVQDFDSLYPNSKNSLFTEWANFSLKVKRLVGIDENEEVPDSQIFLWIGKLFEIEGVSSVAVTKKYRATKAEMIQSFLFHAQTIDALHPGIDELFKKAEIAQTTIQPFAAIVGTDIKSVDSYCIIAGIQYRVASVRDAVDITFKSFQALHASYPRSSESFWLLIQKAIYKINTPWDQCIQTSAVESLLDKLNS